MIRKMPLFCRLGVPVLGLLLLLAAPANAQMQAEGVTVTVLAEYTTTVPGLAKVRLIKVEYEPGASIPESLIRSDEFCTITQGALSVMNKTTDTTNIYSVGGRWSLRKGMLSGTRNVSDGPTTMWVYQLVEKE